MSTKDIFNKTIDKCNFLKDVNPADSEKRKIIMRKKIKNGTIWKRQIQRSNHKRKNNKSTTDQKESSNSSKNYVEQ